MAEFKLKRADILKFPPICPGGLEVFDAVVKSQNNGTQDAILPDGWTHDHSLYLHAKYPVLHDWLVLHRLIPRMPVPESPGPWKAPEKFKMKAALTVPTQAPPGMNLPSLKQIVVDLSQKRRPIRLNKGARKAPPPSKDSKAKPGSLFGRR